MEIPEDPTARLDLLVRTLSEMAKPLGYGVVAASDCSGLGLYRLSDEKRNWAAPLCCVPSGGTKESTAEALLRRYESANSWTTYFYDSWDSATFPGGTPEEIELKAAVGVEALFTPSRQAVLKNFFDEP